MGTGVCTSWACDAMGLGMSVLQLGQFIPQHVEMYTEKSTVGVSAWLLFFGGLYTWLAALDIVLTGGPNAFTCGSSPYRCFVASQPLLQMVGSALLSLGMWYWYLLYQPPRSGSVANVTDDDVEGDTYGYGTTRGSGGAFVDGGGGAPVAMNEVSPDWSDFDGTLCFRVLLLLMSLSVGAAAAVVHLGTSADVEAFAHGCGYVAGVLNAVMWLPQIVSTWGYKHKGALSLYWVLASVVCDIVYTTYLIFMGLDISVWINNVPDGLQTALLFCLVTYFSWRDRAAGLDDFGHPLHYTPEGEAEHVEARLLLAKGRRDLGYQQIEA
ncbi:hypothetical protein MMPV_004685 [Pyropia vietnamensis]